MDPRSWSQPGPSGGDLSLREGTCVESKRSLTEKDQLSVEPEQPTHGSCRLGRSRGRSGQQGSPGSSHGCPEAAAEASSREQNPGPGPGRATEGPLGLRPDLVSLTDVTLFCSTSSFGAVT